MNPLVAVLLGYFVAGEALGPRTLLGSALVLLSVVVITTIRNKQARAPSLGVTAPKTSPLELDDLG